jgi:hypothetical protein
MIPGNAIKELLQHNTLITALCGDRIFPVVRPQNIAEAPAIVYQLINNEPTAIKDGPSPLDTLTYQFSMFAPEHLYDELVRIREALRFTFERINTTAAGIQVQSISLQAQRDFFEDDARMHHFADDYRFRMIRNPAEQESIAAYQYRQRVAADGGQVADFNAIKNLTINP